MVEVKEPKLFQSGDKVQWISSVDDLDLWFAVPKEFESFFSMRSDAALIALLMPCMLQGEDIIFHGPLSEDLFFKIPILQNLINLSYPKARIIKVFANNLIPSERMATGVATGFSGGIDSFSVIKRMLFDSPPNSMRLTHLTIHDVYMPQDYLTFDFSQMPRGFRNIRALATEWGIPLISVSSNVGQFYKMWRFEDTHTLRNASVAHALSCGLSRFIYGSTYPYNDIQVGNLTDIATIDPILLPLISTISVTLDSGDPERSRAEKTFYLGNFEYARSYLQVCAVGWEKNCSSCFKCRRTLLTLDIFGILDNFSEVFDINKYLLERDGWASNALHSQDKFMVDIVQTARKYNFSLARFGFDN